MNKTFKFFVGLFLTIFCSMFGKTTAFETSIGDHSFEEKPFVRRELQQKYVGQQWLSTIKSEDVPNGCDIVTRDLTSGTTFFESFDPNQFSKLSSSREADLKDKATFERSLNDAAFLTGQLRSGTQRTRVMSPKNSPFLQTARIVITFNRAYNQETGTYEELQRIGTAFLEGPNLAVTAAHCIYWDFTDDGIHNGTFADKIEFFFGLDGEGYSPSYQYYAKAEKIHIEAHYAITLDHSTDWAAIELDRPIGDSISWYGKVMFNSSDKLDGETIYTWGYPGDASPQDTMWQNSGLRIDYGEKEFIFVCDFATSRGQSGSPLFYKNPSGYYLVCGVAVGGDGEKHITAGVMFREFIYRFLDQYHCSKNGGYTYKPLDVSGQYTIINNSPWRRLVEYNAKLCFKNDGLKWNGLKDIKSIYVDPYGRATVSVSINWFADSFACSYVYEGKRVITCGGSSAAINYA